MKIKRIKILNLPTRHNSTHIPPYGPASITSFLRKKGFYVDQDDLNQKVNGKRTNLNDDIQLPFLLDYDRALSYAKGDKDKELDNLADSVLCETDLKNFDIFFLAVPRGITPTARIDLTVPYIFSKRLKDRFNKPVVIGGMQIDSPITEQYIIEAVSKGFFDYYIFGDGEISSFQLIEALNNSRSLKNIRGLVYLHNKRVIQNKKDTLPVLIKPDFKGLPLELYTWHPKSGASEKILILPFRFMTGCTDTCAFCSVSVREKLLAMPPKIAAQCLKELSEEYNTKYFFFLSNHINLSEEYLNEFCDEIIKLNLNILWTDSARLSNLNKRLILKMRKAGCIGLAFGIETGSHRLLCYIRKGINIPSIKEILKWCNDSGIWTTVNFIAGLPTENEKDIGQTIDFIKENSHLIDEIAFSVFTLRGNSRFLLHPQDYGLSNIRPVLRKDYDNQRSQFGFYCVGYEFDEPCVLWKDKSTQIMHSYDSLRHAVPKHKAMTFFFDKLPLLFFFYSLYGNKAKVKTEYEKESVRLLNKYALHNFWSCFRNRFWKLLKDPLKISFKELKQDMSYLLKS
jgi:radical SAM superfamily enzyme YgiQ (UPF0313 family)